MVRLEQNVDPAVIAERYDLTAGAVRLGSGGIYQFKALNPRVSATQRILNQMQADEDIVWAERNFTGELPVEGKPFGTWAWGGNDDTQYTSQAAYEQINLAAAHTRAKGDNIVIAVLDTGVDLKHPALTEHLVSGWDMLDDDAIPQDEGSGVAYGHGSHVSGIVAQVAPNSLIMPIRVLDSNGLGDSFILAYAIDWATEQGADVINLSLGMTEYSRVLHQAVRDATNSGVVIVGAAGNRSTAELNYPAAFPQVIGVTAVDGENQLASFANYGPSASIAAPGVGIRSTIPTASGPGYASWSGTSMAAPFVSGAAALVRQLDSNSSSQDVTSTLVTSGSTVSTQAENGNIPLVWPLLNAGAAVGASNTGTQPEDSPTTPSNPNPSALTINLFLPLVQQ